jgi:REP element-mobilizing transposase RayT
MAHTYTNLWTHALFSTKDRERFLDRELKARLFPYMAGIIENLKGQALLINGPADHVHMLFVLPADLALAELVKKVKANSSRWVHENWPSRARFAWQTGYAAFSVSQSKVGEVKRYLANQEQHHRKVTSQEEVLAFLKKHGIRYDLRYVFT